ncbi:hypothetical protein PR048_019318 [Dryococelus australis]|uniref:NF-X1-type domain-containing protein n=1 Tax=Dryococelus australis TaxID=614101 RepID=A0ABQ9H371_9NEOP|nr:hypothetical protein PR048_019318 [Dryococelus australis]
MLPGLFYTPDVLRYHPQGIMHHIVEILVEATGSGHLTACCRIIGWEADIIGISLSGNMDNLTQSSEIWQKIRSSLVSQQSLGEGLTLRCQIHPNSICQVRTAGDFAKNVPEGGCMEPCLVLMSCGHKCQSMCHIQDREHTFSRCLQECPRIPRNCTFEHKCPKPCRENCGDCRVIVTRQLPCGHSKDLMCHIDYKTYNCLEWVKVTLPNCGHDADKPCHKNIDIFSCPHPWPEVAIGFTLAGTPTDSTTLLGPESYYQPKTTPTRSHFCSRLKTLCFWETVPSELLCPSDGDSIVDSAPLGLQTLDFVVTYISLQQSAFIHKARMCHNLRVSKTTTSPCHTRVKSPQLRPHQQKTSIPQGGQLVSGGSSPFPALQEMSGLGNPKHIVFRAVLVCSLQYKCRKPCTKTYTGCSKHHKCAKRCHEVCGDCTVLDQRKLECGHMHKVACSKDLATVECHRGCNRDLLCGHKCKKKCFEKCGDCQEKVFYEQRHSFKPIV